MSLFDRTMSSIPVSIGTSLALESIFKGDRPPYDPDRKIPQQVDLKKYDECWVNVDTLLRNIQGSVTSVDWNTSNAKQVLDVLLTEMEIIQSLFQIEGQGTCTPIFYRPQYSRLPHLYGNMVQFRENSTEKGAATALKLKQVRMMLEKQTDQIQSCDPDLKPRHPARALVITHYAWDLLSEKHFRTLDLLESHTGILKGHAQWNTKYAPLGKEDLTHLPFTSGLLILFGDKTLIQPHELKVRRVVHDISVKGRWTPYTTREKICTDIKSNVLDPYLFQYLMKLL